MEGFETISNTLKCQFTGIDHLMKQNIGDQGSIKLSCQNSFISVLWNFRQLQNMRSTKTCSIPLPPPPSFSKFTTRGLVVRFQLVDVAAHHPPIVCRIRGNVEMVLVWTFHDGCCFLQSQECRTKVCMCWEAWGCHGDQGVKGGCVFGQVGNVGSVLAPPAIWTAIPFEPWFFELGQWFPILDKLGAIEVECRRAWLTFPRCCHDVFDN